MTTEEKLEDLERRLASYHFALAEAIQERDRLALDAAWGVHLGLYTFAGVALLLFMVDRYLGDVGWFGDALVGVALAAVVLGVGAWSNGSRMKEVESLSILPEWQENGWIDEDHQ